MSETKSKPPTIRVSMDSVAPEKIYLGDNPADQVAPIEVKINWGKLLGLPPFQMFMAEHCRQDICYVDKWIDAELSQMVRIRGEENVFELYRDWHGKKGWWKNETVYGEFSGA